MLQVEMGNAITHCLRPFLPEAVRVEVTLRHASSSRKIKHTAPADAFSPAKDYAELSFKAGDAPSASSTDALPAERPAPKRTRFPRLPATPEAQAPTPAAAAARDSAARSVGPGDTADARVDRLVRALARAENSPNRRFVALKWFRDQALAQEGIYPPESRDLLNSALRAGMVLTRKQANPHRPEYPVTAVYLDHNHPGVQSALRQAERRFSFQPVEVRGEPVSASLLRDRR
jgi:hypothetical protein